MKNLIILILVFSSTSLMIMAQNSNENKLTMSFQPLVQEFVKEYNNEAKIRGLDIENLISSKIDFIVYESDIKEDGNLLNKNQLSMIDVEKKMILLSDVCKVDWTLLKSELFKQLSFFLGVKPIGQNTIISNEFTPKYTNAYLTDPELRKEEYDFMFSELKKVINATKQ